MKENDPRPNDGTSSSTDLVANTLTREKDVVKPFANQWKELFLQALAAAPIVAIAAKIAGVSPRRAREERSADAAFARQWDEAVERGIDEIEAAAYVSAVHGDKRPVFHQGKQIGWKVDYSHTMRSMLLRTRRPEVFGGNEQPQTRGTKPLTLDEFRKRLEEARR